MPTSLPKEAFLAIAAVGWADGRMRKDEAAGLIKAAESIGLGGDDLEAVEAAAATESRVEDVDLSALSPWQLALTYACANWVAKLDGVVNAEEVKSLRALGEATGLPDNKLQAARSAAFDIAVLPGGNRPEKYDFSALENRLKEKLPALYKTSLPPPEME